MLKNFDDVTKFKKYYVEELNRQIKNGTLKLGQNEEIIPCHSLNYAEKYFNPYWAVTSDGHIWSIKEKKWVTPNRGFVCKSTKLFNGRIFNLNATELIDHYFWSDRVYEEDSDINDVLVREEDNYKSEVVQGSIEALSDMYGVSISFMEYVLSQCGESNNGGLYVLGSNVQDFVFDTVAEYKNGNYCDANGEPIDPMTYATETESEISEPEETATDDMLMQVYDWYDKMSKEVDQVKIDKDETANVICGAKAALKQMDDKIKEMTDYNRYLRRKRDEAIEHFETLAAKKNTFGFLKGVVSEA